MNSSDEAASQFANDSFGIGPKETMDMHFVGENIDFVVCVPSDSLRRKLRDEDHVT